MFKRYEISLRLTQSGLTKARPPSTLGKFRHPGVQGHHTTQQWWATTQLSSQHILLKYILTVVHNVLCIKYLYKIYKIYKISIYNIFVRKKPEYFVSIQSGELVAFLVTHMQWQGKFARLGTI